jgi:hypothetical protein
VRRAAALRRVAAAKRNAPQPTAAEQQGRRRRLEKGPREERERERERGMQRVGCCRRSETRRAGCTRARRRSR